tara:strand:+ start:112 stop:315 length:204 start_codon:yes stop_codon:yes gene_type:complete
MDTKITIKVGGTYSMIEREHQVLVIVTGHPPQILSHDSDITKALKDAVAYIEQKHVEAENEYTKKIR